MSFSQQLGFTSYTISPSPVTSSQLPPPQSSSISPTPSMSSACCENGQNLVHPHTGQTVCSCQYPPGLLTYSRMGLPDAVYPGSAYSATQGYMSLGGDPSAFYPPLNSPYELKEAGETWRGIGQHPSCYPYDPTVMPAHHYPNAYGGMDINSAARRKNATRENTNTLKAWLYEHRKNPYPTKGEKIMLAIITKMTLTQVSTWFANARRRLKKENKMTWSPRNKPGGNDEDDEDDDDSKDKADNAESDSEDARRKSPKDDKKSCDREGQLSSDITDGSSPCNTMRTVRMYDTPLDSTHMSMPRLPGMTEHNLRRCSGNFPSLSMPPETSASFLTLQSMSCGYSDSGAMGCMPSHDGSMAPVTETPSGSASKRPDSLCSNSNDSGLSDVNCSYPESSLDGIRPKIWSLAHVATSDAAYTNHNTTSSASNGNNSGLSNNLPRSMSGAIQRPCMIATPGSSLPLLPSGLQHAGFSSGHIRHDDIQSSSSSASSSLSSFTPSPSMPPHPSSMPHWGHVYGGPTNLGGPHEKSAHLGPLVPQPLPGMSSVSHMAPPTRNSMSGLHNSSPTPCYGKGLSPSAAYYSSSKMAFD